MVLKVSPTIFDINDVFDREVDIIKNLDEFGFICFKMSDELKDLNVRLNEHGMSFFSLTRDEKNKFIHSRAGGIGYFPFEYEKAVGSHAPDHKEFWHCTLASVTEDRLWPKSSSRWRETSSSLIKELNKLACSLVNLLTKNEFSDTLYASDLESWSTLRQVFYPQLSKVQVEKDIAALHTGIQCLGLQMPGTERGLEFYNDKYGWMELADYRDVITVNIGETLELISNKRFRATPHRVRKAAEVSSRLANIYFFHLNPNYSAVVNGKKTLIKDFILGRINEISKD